MQIKLALFLVGEVTRGVEHLGDLAFFIAFLRNEACLEPSPVGVSIFRHDGVRGSHALRKGAHVQEFAHVIAHLGGHEGAEDAFDRAIDAAGARGQPVHQVNALDDLIGAGFKIDHENGGVNVGQGRNDLGMLGFPCKCVFQLAVAVQQLALVFLVADLVVAHEQEHADHQGDHDNRGDDGGIAQCDLVVGYELVGWLHVGFDAYRADDLAAGIVVNRVAGGEDVSPCGVDDVL